MKSIKLFFIAVASISLLALGVIGLRAGYKIFAPRLKRLVTLAPTYPKATLVEDLKKMCSKEYRLDVQARVKDGSLQVFYWQPGLMNTDGEVRASAADAVNNVFVCATRAALSTDAKLDFIEVKVVDIVTGSSLTLWRNIRDIHRYFQDSISAGEYLNRLVVDFNSDAAQASDGRIVKWSAPLTMAQFLAKQAISRARKDNPMLQAHEDLSDPAKLVVVIDNWSTFVEAGQNHSTQAADGVEKTVNSVIKRYRFDGFNGVVLQDPRGMALRSWRL